MRSFAVLLAAAIGAAAPMALAKDGVRGCAGITGDAQRLACYDEAAGRSAIAPAVSPSGTWDMFDRTDPMDDRRILGISTEAISGRACTSQTPTLIVRCIGDRLDFYIFHGCYVPGDRRTGYDAAVEVRLRLDDLAAEKLTMWATDDSEALGYWGTQANRTMLPKFLRRSRMLIEITPPRSTRQIIEFDLTGLDQELSQSGIAAQCGIEDLLEGG